jgi:hypothetical protein
MSTLEQKFLRSSSGNCIPKFCECFEAIANFLAAQLGTKRRYVLRDPLAASNIALHRRPTQEGKKQQAPPELLEEVFALNESLDELRETRNPAEISSS